MKTVAAFVILAGVVLLFTSADIFASLTAFAYHFIGGGLILLIIAQLAANREKSWLCRIGLHDFERHERDMEFPAMSWYRCRRCGKEKKAASIA